MAAILDCEEIVGQNPLIDDPIDVSEGDARDDGGLSEPQHIRSRSHSSLHKNYPPRRNIYCEDAEFNGLVADGSGGTAFTMAGAVIVAL